MWPQRQQPTRLPRPWDSPGKNTGVGCHFLLQCMKVKSESEVAQPCPTLCNPMDCSLPGSSVHGIFQARVLEWNAIAFSLFRLVSGNLGRWVWAGTLRVYKVFIKTGQGPWLTGDCLRRAGVINCTPLSALNFWVSLFPRTHDYNKVIVGSMKMILGEEKESQDMIQSPVRHTWGSFK